MTWMWNQAQIDRIERKLDLLLAREKTVMATLDDVKTKVEAENTVIDSAITLLGDLSAQIAALKNDPAALQALADEIDAKKAALAAAVAANTPAP
jgi:prefoldin subunit 5